MTEHRGEIVIAEPQEITGNSYYKLIARIRTGYLSGNCCYVSHRGDVSQIINSFIIRLDIPFRRFVDRGKEDSTYGHFVTSTVPHDFEFSNSANTVLYGIWLDRMKGGFDIPLIGKISNFFDIGIMPYVLHYLYRNGLLIPYELTKGGGPIVWRRQGGRIMPPGYALRKYLRDFHSDYQQCPRVVTIEANSLRLEEKVLEEIRKLELKHLEMEPQQ